MKILTTLFTHRRFRPGNALWLVAALLFFALRGVVQAQFSYTTNNGAITITRYNGSGDSVAIPATTNGLPVTGIGYEAFYSSSLTNVTIPNSVTSIGNAAFSYCSSLTSITVDPSNPAYSSSNGVLFDKAQVTIIQFPVGLFGSYAISNTVTRIGDYAFYGSSLTGVTIPNSVTSVGTNGFNSCYSLASVAIPSSVTNIGKAAFSACTSLTDITVDPSNPAYSSTNGVLFDKAQAKLIQAPGGLTGSFAIPNSVVSIGDDAFYQCFNLTSVAISDSLASVGDHAFYQCTSLTGVTLPNGVTNIAAYAFGSCSSLAGVTIPDGVTSIGTEAFNSCYALTSVTVPSSVTSIGSAAFSSCSSLTSAYFQGNAPPDPGDVFSGDPNATVYYLPGTTGWGAKYGGVRAVLRNPPGRAQEQAPGVVVGQFEFGLSGPTNAVVVVEACTSLANPVWIPVGTNTLTGGSSSFSDPQWNAYPQRFYRFRLP
jgi:hypothetical protein